MIKRCCVILFSFWTLQLSAGDIDQVTIPSYTKNDNLAFVIKDSLESFNFLDNYLNEKNVMEREELEKKLSRLLINNDQLKKEHHLQKLLREWINKNTTLEKYYSVFQAKSCYNYQRQEKGLYKLTYEKLKFFNLQKDFVTYFNYSIAGKLIDLDDIKDEITNFIHFYNLLHKECQSNALLKTIYTDLYEDFIYRSLIPLAKAKFIKRKALTKIIKLIDITSIKDHKKMVNFEYSTEINDLTRVHSSIKGNKNAVQLKFLLYAIKEQKLVPSVDLLDLQKSIKVSHLKYINIFESLYKNTSLKAATDYVEKLKSMNQKALNSMNLKKSNYLGNQIIWQNYSKYSYQALLDSRKRFLETHAKLLQIAKTMPAD
jgi:hypothetical protein